MDMITVDKATLIETVTRNRDQHRDQFLRAQVRFREEAVRILDEHAADARAGKDVRLIVQLPVPKDYTKSYNTVLAMLDWHQGDTWELDQRDFERYVENRWEWANDFAATTQTYLGGR